MCEDGGVHLRRMDLAFDVLLEVEEVELNVIPRGAVAGGEG